MMDQQYYIMAFKQIKQQAVSICMYPYSSISITACFSSYWSLFLTTAGLKWIVNVYH